MTGTICIYHANCRDGFGSAWALRALLGDDVDWHPASYGDDPDEIETVGKHVIMLDFSFRRDAIEQMRKRALSILIIDHHLSAEKELEGLGTDISGWAMPGWSRYERERDEWIELPAKALCPVWTLFDMQRSGAALTWRFCHESSLPLLLRYVEDRDLWRFEMPWSRDVSAWLGAQDQSFEAWDRIDRKLKDMAEIERVAETGRTLVKSQMQMIRSLLTNRRRMVIAGYEVDVCNMPFMFASEAGGILASEGHGDVAGDGAYFAATYFDTPHIRRFSLRSHADGADVSIVARFYGGGGHKHAAGFEAPLGWSGDDCTLLPENIQSDALALADRLEEASSGFGDQIVAAEMLRDIIAMTQQPIWTRPSSWTPGKD